MAVVTRYSTAYMAPTAQVSAEGIYAEGRVRVISAKLDVTNGDSIASLLYLGKVPSSAIFLPNLSNIATAGIAGMTDMDIGLYSAGVVVGGVAANAEILGNAVTVAAASLVLAALNALTAVNWNFRVWQILGLANDPGVEYDIVAKMNTAATAAGSFVVRIAYLKQ